MGAGRSDYWRIRTAFGPPREDQAEGEEAYRKGLREAEKCEPPSKIERAWREIKHRRRSTTPHSGPDAPAPRLRPRRRVSEDSRACFSCPLWTVAL